MCTHNSAERCPPAHGENAIKHIPFAQVCMFVCAGFNLISEPACKRTRINKHKFNCKFLHPSYILFSLNLWRESFPTRLFHRHWSLYIRREFMVLLYPSTVVSESMWSYFTLHEKRAKGTELMRLSGCWTFRGTFEDLEEVNNSRLVTQVGNANERVRAAAHIHSFGHALSNFSTFHIQENNELSRESGPDIMAMVKYRWGILSFWITLGGFKGNWRNEWCWFFRETLHEFVGFTFVFTSHSRYHASSFTALF